MTTIYREFDEVWMTPSASGMVFCEQESFGPVKVRLEIEADSRESWGIWNVWMIRTEIVSQDAQGCRSIDHYVQLEGEFLKQAIEFFGKTDSYIDLLQEKVNHEIIPPVSELYRDYHEAGRTM
jgi:hypothetical protein